MTTPDAVADFLAAVRLRAENVQNCPPDAPDALWRSIHGRSARDVPRLLTALDAVLHAHAPMTIYAAADGCKHPEPSRDDDEGAWDDWYEDHPSGTDASGGMGDGICLLEPVGTACPACTALVYDTHGDEDNFMDAGKCTVRPAISRELLGEVPTDG